jgi:hypothetical protein
MSRDGVAVMRAERRRQRPVFRAAGVSVSGTASETTAANGLEAETEARKIQSGWTPRWRRKSSSLVHRKTSSAGKSR